MAVKEPMESLQKRRSSRDSLRKIECIALMELSTKEDFSITQAFKGEATVIDEYFKEANIQLNNKKFGFELPTGPFEDKQDTLINSFNMFGKNLIKNIRDTKTHQC